MQYVKVMIYKCSHVGDMHFFFKLLITETMHRSNEQYEWFQITEQLLLLMDVPFPINTIMMVYLME